MASRVRKITFKKVSIGPLLNLVDRQALIWWSGARPSFGTLGGGVLLWRSILRRSHTSTISPKLDIRSKLPLVQVDLCNVDFVLVSRILLRPGEEPSQNKAPPPLHVFEETRASGSSKTKSKLCTRTSMSADYDSEFWEESPIPANRALRYLKVGGTRVFQILIPVILPVSFPKKQFWTTLNLGSLVNLPFF